MKRKQFKKITDWQKKTFGKSTPMSKLTHLEKEINELKIDILAKSPKVKEELADCFFLLFGTASALGLDYDDICQAINDKFEINQSRQWGEPDKDGVVNHVKKCPEPKQEPEKERVISEREQYYRTLLSEHSKKEEELKRPFILKLDLSSLSALPSLYTTKEEGVRKWAKVTHEQSENKKDFQINVTVFNLKEEVIKQLPREIFNKILDFHKLIYDSFLPEYHDYDDLAVGDMIQVNESLDEALKVFKNISEKYHKK